MAKLINDVIEDRIEIGKDAMKAKLKLARISECPEVVHAANAAELSLTSAFITLSGVDEAVSRHEADERALGTVDDPRQDSLPGTDGEAGDDDLEG